MYLFDDPASWHRTVPALESQSIASFSHKIALLFSSKQKSKFSIFLCRRSHMSNDGNLCSCWTTA